jgi:hypothetical protein
LRVERGGRVVLSDGADARVGTLQVLEGGVFEGAADGMTARLTILNQPIDSRLDPEQYGTGLIVLGALRLKGTSKTPFVRLAAEPRAGEAALTLSEAPSGWQPGDRVFVPDTRQVPQGHWFDAAWPLHHETRTILRIDGAALVLDAPLRFDHPGARDADGTPTVSPNGLSLLPHVANVTRSIVIRSENPTGTRGHVLMTHRAEIDIRGVGFEDLGRTKPSALDSFPGPATNQIGRYPVHVHLLMGPVNRANTGYQFRLSGNAVLDSRKWPIAIHGSHFGLIEENVIVGGAEATGSGIALEDGSETENLVRRNFVGDIRAHTNPVRSRPSTENGRTPGSAAECIWGAGFNNRFVGNVVTGCRNTFQGVASGVGFKFVVAPAPYDTWNPRFRGADPSRGSQRVAATPQRQKILEFVDNECYGLMSTCMTTWALGTTGYDQPKSQPESVVKNLVAWHTYDGAFWLYPTNRLTVDNLTYRSDPAMPRAAAVTAGDYRVASLTIRGGSIHASSILRNITDPVGVWRIENVATTYGHALNFVTPRTPGTRAPRPVDGVHVLLSGVVVTPWPGQPLRTISLVHSPNAPGAFTTAPFLVDVEGHQGAVGEDFRVYFESQQKELLYGAVAPCSTTRTDVNGIVCAPPAQ